MVVFAGKNIETIKGETGAAALKQCFLYFPEMLQILHGYAFKWINYRVPKPRFTAHLMSSIHKTNCLCFLLRVPTLNFEMVPTCVLLQFF